jgi:hypothetical protein
MTRIAPGYAHTRRRTRLKIFVEFWLMEKNNYFPFFYIYIGILIIIFIIVVKVVVVG